MAESLRNIWTISRRDFRSYFNSPIAYVLIAAFLVIMGWMFFYNLDFFVARNMQYQQSGMGKPISITEGIMRPLFLNMCMLLLMLLPFVTMRLFSEEKKMQTLQLLMTSPVTLGQIIFGKFLSSLLLVLVMLAFTGLYPIILFITGSPELGPILSGYLGIILLSGCYLAIGVLCSAMTENQIIAALLTWAVLIFFLLISWATQSAGPVWSGVLLHLSLVNHFNNFASGIVNTVDIVYYISFIFFGLFLTHKVLDSYRWR